MHQDQRDAVVQYAQSAAVDGDQGHHQDLERDDHGGDHQGEHQGAQLPFAVTHDDESLHGGDQYREDGSAHGNDQGVAEHGPEVHLLHGFREIGQSEAVSADQGQRVGGDVGFGLEDVDDHQDEGHDEAKEEHQEHDPHDDMGYLLLACRLFVICHYASTSPLLPIMTWVTPTMAQTRNRIRASAWPRP